MNQNVAYPSSLVLFEKGRCTYETCDLPALSAIVVGVGKEDSTLPLLGHHMRETCVLAI